MAKVQGPLMSMSASGTLGGALTFDKRGFVRNHVVPANPRSAGQIEARQKLAAVQAVLKLLITDAIDLIKLVAPTTYRWNSYALQQALGQGNSNYDGADAAFTALTATPIANWDSAFADVFVPTVPENEDTPPSGGRAAFIVATGLFNSGAITSPGAPAAGNYAAWATALIP